MRYVNASYMEKEFDLERALSYEWLLTNRLGGYSSSTTVGLNTRKYHGLLVSSDDKLERTVVLQKLEEEVEADGKKFPLSVNEYEGGAIYPNGNMLLKGFKCNLKEASFMYAADEFQVLKTVQMTPLKNTVLVSYRIKNKNAGEISFNVVPLGNIRGYHKLNSGAIDITLSGERSIEIESSGKKVTLRSDKAKAFQPPYDFNKRILYRMERSRGEDCVEDVRCLGFFSHVVGLGEESQIFFLCSDESGGGATYPVVHAAQNQEKSSEMRSRLKECCDSFVVYTPPWKTIVAGYPWFGEWSRDALISLPGLTLVWGNTADAEAILRRFFYLFRGQRLATNTEEGRTSCYDFDGVLWLFDRVLQYLKYVGLSSGRKIVVENWRVLSEITGYYHQLLLDGVITHQSGTWMDTLKRDNAVEIQGLCYNALKTCERFSEAYGLKVRGRIDVSDTAEKIKESFTRAYWNGRFLNDTTQYWESSVRPNQLICASLDYSMLDRRQMADVLKVCEEKLLTEVGLRTLEQGDPRFQGRYIGNFSDRETAYHNGSVWPWLLGPYVKTYVRVHGKKGRKKMKSFLESFFRRTLSDNGLGYVNEIYDGEPPHTPRGCIAQAWSIAEPVRAYFEDALGIRPQYEKEVL